MIRLDELIGYSRITIQCHDVPDADALASGFALYCYFHSKNIPVELIYSGKMRISKSDLELMISELDIPVTYRAPEYDAHIDGLLIMVDCQYGTGNVTKFEADEVAVIDHHIVEMQENELCDIRPELGSCSTLCWSLLERAGYSVNDNEKLATALYYGLYRDTVAFADMSDRLDKEMFCRLEYNKKIYDVIRNTNISMKDLRTTGVALIRSMYNNSHNYGIIPYDGPCDPNILGIISDILLSVEGVDVCCVYNILPDGYKMSVRSVLPDKPANELSAYLTEGIGSGGGHHTKAGGFISEEAFLEKYDCMSIDAYLAERMHQYFEEKQHGHNCEGHHH